MSAAMFVSMLIFFAFSVPIAVSIGFASVTGIQLFSNIPMLVVPKEMFSAIDKFALGAIPFFILAGNLMEVGGISNRLVQLAKSIVGGLQGGFGHDLRHDLHDLRRRLRLLGSHHLRHRRHPHPRALIKHGYPTSFAAALQATSAELGVIIPSIPMILYGVSAEVSIGELFIAGFGPGLLIGGGLMFFVWLWSKYKGYGKDDHLGRMSFGQATREAALALMMPVIILGGIYGGVFTPTEAAVVAVFYALIVGMGIYREIKLKDLYPIFRKSVISRR